MNSFESHVTVKKPKDPTEYEEIAKRLGWHTSAIDGDPEMGDRVFFYFTRRGSSKEQLLKAIDVLRAALGERTVLREKIEEIVWDTTYAWVDR